MFAKNTLASAVAAAIGVTAVGTAQAGTAFWPYVAISDTVTTVISSINTDTTNWTSGGVPTSATSGDRRLHYRLFYKAASAALTEPCDEYDEYLPTSVNDLQTFDLGGVYGANDLGVLFGDPSVANNWKSVGLDYALGRNIKPARGYLMGDTGSGNDTLRGEAFIFEFGTGAAWGYEAYHQGSSGAGAALHNSAAYYYDFRWAASQSPSQVSLMPLAEMTTAFFVTPVDADQSPITNNYRARIGFATGAGFTAGRGDVFDRDENLISGTVAQDVVCVGRVNVEALLSDGTRARIRDTGGWARIWNYRVVPGNGGWVPASWADAWNVNNHYVLQQALGLNANQLASAVGQSIYSDLVPAEENGWDPTYLDGREGVTTEQGLSSSAQDYGYISYPWSWLRGAVVIKLEYNQPGATFNGETIGGGNVINNGIMYAPPQWRY